MTRKTKTEPVIYAWQVEEKEERLRVIDSWFPTRIRLIEMLAEDVQGGGDQHALIPAIQMLAEDLQNGYFQARSIRMVLPSLKARLAQQNAAE